MYAQHVTAIRHAFEADSADTLEATVRFALATIQQRFHTVPAILDDWFASGSASPTMWGMKKKGVKFIRKHKVALAAQLLTATTVEAVDILLTVPGLGIVKAGFVAQLLGHDIGCIDTHNARMYGIKIDTFRITNKHTAKTRLAKIKSYQTLCKELGGAQVLWDNWCHFVAIEQGEHFCDAEDVSAEHVKQIVHRDVPF
jgi:hypothetical protein